MDNIKAEVAARRYGLKTVDILVELGRRRMVGGQEDMIVDVALDLLKHRDGLNVGSSVSAEVRLGKLDDLRFGIAVDLNVHLPGMPPADAEKLVVQTHTVCPYSNATRGNVAVGLFIEDTAR